MEIGRFFNGFYDKLYIFGGRGFFIWKLDIMFLVYDSGSDVEDIYVQVRLDFFNV